MGRVLFSVGSQLLKVVDVRLGSVNGHPPLGHLPPVHPLEERVLLYGVGSVASLSESLGGVPVEESYDQVFGFN
jgi:hypothetical protein